MTAAPSSAAPDAEWSAFRDEAVRQVPGLPAAACRSFDVTRHGTLDHVQRVALRALAHDLGPDLSPLAIEAATTLGAMADLVGPAALLPRDRTGLASRARGSHRTARVALVPVDGAHMPSLYRSATGPRTGFRWRFRGRTPSPEEFHTSLFTGVAAQHVVESTADGTPIGLVVAYDEDPMGNHCHVGFLRIDEHDAVPGGTLEGLVLFIDFVFATFPYRKVFADMPEYNLPLVSGIPDDVLRREGRMRDFYWHDGRYWDRCFLSLDRATWEGVVTALLP